MAVMEAVEMVAEVRQVALMVVPMVVMVVSEAVEVVVMDKATTAMEAAMAVMMVGGAMDMTHKCRSSQVEASVLAW